MKSLKCLLLSLTFIFTSQSAFAIIASSVSQTEPYVPSVNVSKKKKIGFFKQFSLKKAQPKGAADGVAAILCGIAAVIFFSLSAAQTGLVGILSSIILTSVGIVMLILCFIFLIRWLINQAKEASQA